MTDFVHLLEGEIPRLRRYARALTRDTSRADDLVQSGLVRAIAKQHLWQEGGDAIERAENHAKQTKHERGSPHGHSEWDSIPKSQGLPYTRISADPPSAPKSMGHSFVGMRMALNAVSPPLAFSGGPGTAGRLRKRADRPAASFPLL